MDLPDLCPLCPKIPELLLDSEVLSAKSAAPNNTVDGIVVREGCGMILEGGI